MAIIYLVCIGRGRIPNTMYMLFEEFTIEEHPFRGITGFNTWYDSMDGIGYWVLYIDPMTGNIIYPINPMVPSE